MSNRDYYGTLKAHILSTLSEADQPMTIAHLTEKDGRLIFSKQEARFVLLILSMAGVIDMRLLTTIDPHDEVAVYWMNPLQKLAAL